MKNHGYYKTPEHGLQIEETHKAGDREGAIHLFRYWWAFDVGRLMNPEVVFDLGCGGGYGSRIMLEIPSVKKIVGVDGITEAVDTARSSYADQRLSFAAFNLENYWLECTNKDFAFPQADMIVAFEMFELLRHREFFLEQVVDTLNSDGVLLLSANFVNRKQCHSQPTDANFHYNRKTLERLLLRYFDRVLFADEQQENMHGSHPFRILPHYNAVVRENTTPNNSYKLGENCVFCAGPRR